MRVHLFRRDRWLREGRAAGSAKAGKNALFVAYKENLILEKYFGQTLEKSSYKWEAEEKGDLAGLIGQDRAYRSPVSAGAFQIKEALLWAGIFVFLAALVGLDLVSSRAKQKIRGRRIEK
jgi:hypothetical protein